MRTARFTVLALAVISSCGVRDGTQESAAPLKYVKHQLFLDGYEVRDGVVKLPDKCNWLVRKHQGGKEWGKFAPAGVEEGDVCLILNEPRTATSGFWPVMSFLTEKEADELADQLRRATRRSPGEHASD